VSEYVVGGLVTLASYVLGEIAGGYFDDWRAARKRPVLPPMSIDVGDLPMTLCGICGGKFYSLTASQATRSLQRHMETDHRAVKS
jgi:hypothetical protein